MDVPEEKIEIAAFSTESDCGAEYLVFVSSRPLKTREKCKNWDNLVCLSLYIFFTKYFLL